MRKKPLFHTQPPTRVPAKISVVFPLEYIHDAGKERTPQAN